MDVRVDARPKEAATHKQEPFAPLRQVDQQTEQTQIHIAGSTNTGAATFIPRNCRRADGSITTSRNSTPSKSTTPFTDCPRHRPSPTGERVPRPDSCTL